MNVDEDSFIKTYKITAGSIHDSQVFESLLTGTETVMYADSANKSWADDELPGEKRIDNRILKRTYRNKALTAEDKYENQRNASTSTVVERVFGALKFHQSMSKNRYLGLVRNMAWVGLLSISHNLRRGMRLHQCCYS